MDHNCQFIALFLDLGKQAVFGGSEVDDDKHLS
jgi:hypothetical protein